mmetsp:Transcript_38259/g.118846  ORF Transcript_38259/g.118846 Transcript_38259/m.118846 type:complete len:208 (-) Transcript_38259:1149-1772(-)
MHACPPSRRCKAMQLHALNLRLRGISSGPCNACTCSPGRVLLVVELARVRRPHRRIRGVRSPACSQPRLPKGHRRLRGWQRLLLRPRGQPCFQHRRDVEVLGPRVIAVDRSLARRSRCGHRGRGRRARSGRSGGRMALGRFRLGARLLLDDLHRGADLLVADLQLAERRPRRDGRGRRGRPREGLRQLVQELRPAGEPLVALDLALG